MRSMDLSRAIGMLPRSKVIRFREDAGGRSGGFRTGHGLLANKIFFASVQPTTPRQMQMLMGGEEVSGAITIYTKESLRTSETQGTLADRIEWEGRRYKVVAEANWGPTGFSMYIATTEAPREERGAAA